MVVMLCSVPNMCLSGNDNPIKCKSIQHSDGYLQNLSYTGYIAKSLCRPLLTFCMKLSSQVRTPTLSRATFDFCNKLRKILQGLLISAPSIHFGQQISYRLQIDITLYSLY